MIEVPAGTTIQTVRGIYTSQTQEFWYSQDYVDQLQNLFIEQ